MARILDAIFFLYFASHIPITLFIDLQALLPEKLYPAPLVELKDWYNAEFKDSMMADPPAWFLGIVICEALLQFPYFFVATYAYFKGAQACQWIRIPNMVYASHVSTTVIAITFHILFHDFSQSKHPGPGTMKERLTLLSIYSPYLLIPLTMLFDTLFSSAYTARVDSQQKKRR